MKHVNPRLRALATPFEQDHTLSWEREHPRPQMKRKEWRSLCGMWSLAVKKNGDETELGMIRVPFPPESRLSKVERPLGEDERYVYRTSFVLDFPVSGTRLLLHFGAVDQIATVWVNGKQVGTHVGGYLPFTLDITEAVTEGNNQLRVEAIDTLDLDLAYGKQCRERGGMWYTPISGIWQPVWLEQVPEDYIQTLRLTPTTHSITIETTGGKKPKTLTIQTEHGEQVHTYEGDCITIELDNPILWTPEHPYLYPITLTDGTDAVESYFALRTITMESVNGQAYICLNGKPEFFHGLLDQGYYSDGIYLPATPEGYRYDILTMKKLGFNMLRKHIKMEPEVFYYYCDKYGMVVFQDMMNSGTYHYVVDTALPTIGFKRGVTHRPSSRRRMQFERDCRETIALLYNHPCVCYYTIFNEGWGQYEADRIYKELKAIDPSRIWDATSGWFPRRDSDVTSEHVYFRKIKLKARPDRPLVLSEFGGYSCKIPDHSFNLDQTYGYKKFEERGEFQAALEKLYREEIGSAIEDGLCAAVLTQVSDVEDETNGLVTYDRRVIKVEETAMRTLADELSQTFARKTAQRKPVG